MGHQEQGTINDSFFLNQDKEDFKRKTKFEKKNQSKLG